MSASIGPVDANATDVARLVEAHLAFAHRVTPPGHVHAVGTTGLTTPSVTVLGARDEDGRLVAIGALRGLDDGAAEVKSMHVVEEARGRGLGRALLAALVDLARAEGRGRVLLETGTYDAFEPARRLYAAAGFVPCPPFGAYTANEHSTCMVLELGP